MLRKQDLIRWNLLSTKLNEAKTKLQQLENRQGKYASLPQNIYYKTADDGETVIIYGLNYGDTDAGGAALNYGPAKAGSFLPLAIMLLIGMRCFARSKSANFGRYGRYLSMQATACSITMAIPLINFF